MEGHELTDLGALGQCGHCGDGLNTADWLWYVDGGSVHLTFCQDCGPPDGEWKRTARATATRLTCDRSGEEFVRLVSIEDWFDD